MAGLMGVEAMAKLANANTPKPYTNWTGTIDTTASLGIGAPPSNGLLTEPGYYNWADLLCKMTPDVNQSPAKYNIMNIGGWGNDGVNPIKWQRTDVDMSDGDIEAIVYFLGQNKYHGISFDIEGLSGEPGWNSNEAGGGAALLNDACRRIQLYGYMAWIVLPAFNVKTTHGGPLKITNWDHITLVQLMVYGKGLDSVWGGDPSSTATAITPGQVTQVIKDLKGTPDKIMLAFSYNTGGGGQEGSKQAQEKHFMDMATGPGQFATAGLFAWCKGNGAMFTWTGPITSTGKLGTCDSTKQGGATVPVPLTDVAWYQASPRYKGTYQSTVVQL